jgi:hypothetical protein
MRALFLSSVYTIYALAAAAREFIPGREGWVFGMVAFHCSAALVLRFLTNSKLFAAGVAVAAIAFECALLAATKNGMAAIWAGTLVEALLAGYFLRRVYLTMGD